MVALLQETGALHSIGDAGFMAEIVAECDASTLQLLYRGQRNC